MSQFLPRSASIGSFSYNSFEFTSAWNVLPFARQRRNEEDYRKNMQSVYSYSFSVYSEQTEMKINVHRRTAVVRLCACVLILNKPHLNLCALFYPESDTIKQNKIDTALKLIHIRCMKRFLML